VIAEASPKYDHAVVARIVSEAHIPSSGGCGPGRQKLNPRRCSSKTISVRQNPHIVVKAIGIDSTKDDHSISLLSG